VIRLVALCFVGLAACASIPQLAPGVEPGAVVVLPPDKIDGAANLPLGARPSTPAHYLHVLVQSVGFRLESGFSHLRSLQEDSSGKLQKNVGHTWVRLEIPEHSIGVGHTGEFGKGEVTYGEDVRAALLRNDPNAIAPLWKVKHDGVRWEESDALLPTYHCRVPITSEQAQAIAAYIEDYRYEEFALRGRGCSHFAVGAANLAGLEIANRIRVEIPQRILWMGNTRTLWTDPKYRELQYGSPEVFERDLRRLVALGQAEEISLD
jgi:hypothetical protein